MNFSTWLKAEVGRSKALAAHMDYTAAAISFWKKYGVPVRLMEQIRDYTGGAVTLDEMVAESAAAERRPKRVDKGSAAAITVNGKKKGAPTKASSPKPDRRKAPKERRVADCQMVPLARGELRLAPRRAAEKTEG